MAHTISVPVRIVPDDPNNSGLWPPVEDGTNYDLEDKAITAASRPAALAAAEALESDLAGTGWHVEIPPEPPAVESHGGEQ
jgi:hypothetical protein